MLNHITYDSFGQVTSETDPTFDFRFGYTGRERDAESDLMYYRARYFDPATGSFVGEDPLGFDAGDANLYRYVFNSPTNFTDPSGLSGEIPYGQIAKETAIGIGAALAGIYQSGKNIVNEWNNRPRQTQTPTSVEAISTPDLPGANVFPTTVATPGAFDPNDAQRQPQARPQTDSLTPPRPRPTPGTSEDFNPNRINDKTHSHPNSRDLIWPGGFCPAPWLNGDSDTDGLDRDWFESGNLDGSLTPAQKARVRQVDNVIENIEKQLPKRGWTQKDIEEVIENPARTVPTRDTRYRPDGTRENALATAYIDKDGHYVVQNDETGDIVQVSDRNDPNWQSPF